MDVSSDLNVIRNSVIGYFGNLYLRGEKNKVGEEGVFNNFSWKRGAFSSFLVAKRLQPCLVSHELTEWSFLCLTPSQFWSGLV